MATAAAPFNSLSLEEDFIDMELTSSSSSSTVFRYSIGSPPQSRDFEFQFHMASFSDRPEPATSPADELFYKGKLLPLHLPPRLQMVQNLIRSPNSEKQEPYSENPQIPPESNDASPTESCRPSCEFNSDEYLFGWRSESKGFVDQSSRKSWVKKFKQIKESSRSYLKAFFSKSSCSDNGKVVYNEESEICLNGLNDYSKVCKKTPFGRIDYNKWRIQEKFDDGGISGHRRSFSGAIQRNSGNKSSCSSTSSSGSSSLSSSFSFSSNGVCDSQLLKRSVSANSDIESSIEGAIAHCKQSQKLFGSVKMEVES